MEMNIENVPNYTIAYMRHTGPYGQDNKDLMEKLKSFAKENNLFNNETIILGIAQDNPQITEPQNCRYDVCLVLGQDYKIDSSCSDINLGKVAGGKYAVFIINHTAEDVQNAWNGMFKELVSSGYKIDLSRTIIERYSNKKIKDHKCEICVPIE